MESFWISESEWQEAKMRMTDSECLSRLVVRVLQMVVYHHDKRTAETQWKYAPNTSREAQLKSD